MANFKAKVHTLISGNFAQAVVYNETDRIWNLPQKKTLVSLVEEITPLGMTVIRKLRKDMNIVMEIHNELEGQTSRTKSFHLGQRAEQCARHMFNNGIKEGDVVVTVSQMTRDITPIFLACLVIGATFTPLSVDLDEETLDKLFKTLKPIAVFFDDRFRRKILNVLDKDNLVMFYTLGTELDSVSRNLYKMLKGAYEKPDLGIKSGEIAACKVYIDGKLVTFTQLQLRKAAMNWTSIRDDDIILIGCTISNINHLTLLLKSLLSRVPRVVTGFAVNEQIYCDIIRRHKVTKFYSSVSVIWSMLNISQQEESFRYSLNTLRTVTSFEEFFPSKLLSYVVKGIPKCRPSSAFVVPEGASVMAFSDSLISANVSNGGLITPNLFYKIIDDKMKALNPDENGVLCIKYACHGFRDFEYIKGSSDESTIKDSCFKEKVSITEDGWLITGHYARISNNGVILPFGKMCRNIICDGVLVSRKEIYKQKL